MWLDNSQYDIWSNAGQFFPGPVIVEVDATKTGGPDDNDFGIICNYQDTDNDDKIGQVDGIYDGGPVTDFEFVFGESTPFTIRVYELKQSL